MFARIFTKEEADALLPEIQRVLSQMRQARAELKEAQARLPEARGLERRALEEEVRFLLGSLEADARYLASLGVFLKDLDQGLVDFPGRVGGQVVFLCWKEGEPEVAHYHPLSGASPSASPSRKQPLPFPRRPAPAKSVQAPEVLLDEVVPPRQGLQVVPELVEEGFPHLGLPVKPLPRHLQEGAVVEGDVPPQVLKPPEGRRRPRVQVLPQAPHPLKPRLRLGLGEDVHPLKPPLEVLGDLLPEPLHQLHEGLVGHGRW